MSTPQWTQANEPRICGLCRRWIEFGDPLLILTLRVNTWNVVLHRCRECGQASRDTPHDAATIYRTALEQIATIDQHWPAPPNGYGVFAITTAREALADADRS